MLVGVVYDLSDRRRIFPRYYPSCRISSPPFHWFIMHTWLSSHSVYSWTSIKWPPIKQPSSIKRPVIRGTQRICKISVRGSRCCLEFTIAWGRLKISRWLTSIHVHFSKLIYLFPYDFLKFNSLHFIAQVRLFFVQKGNLKFSDSKMWWTEES